MASYRVYKTENTDSDSGRKNAKVWSYQEGKALISVYESRKDEYFQCRKKRIFWESILADLEELSVLESPTTVEQVEAKWRCLYRAFKIGKERGATGRGVSKFLYMDEMNAIFGNTAEITRNSTADSVGGSDDGEEFIDISEPLAKRHKLSDSLLEIKKQYYADKLLEKQKMREMLEKHFQDKEEARAERHNDLITLLSNNRQ